MKRPLLILVLSCFTFILTNGQSTNNTVGLLSYNPTKAFDGYNLIYPHNQPNVYLLNNCGEIVHVWEDDPNFRPGNTAYLLEDGRLVKTKRPAAVANDPIWAGGGGATVEIRDWDNNLEWSFTLNDSLFRLHHDIAITEEGNILMIAWEKKTAAEAIQAGRDTALLPDGELWPDYILEVDPETDQIVWEWHIWDHLIQDLDPSKDNYDVVEDHPELMDINYTTNDGGADWMHSNSLDYDSVNNQVILSIPFFSEIWIIDHSTTTAEAASDFGGLSGIGGDLMYRYGNPLVYRRGTEDDQMLFFQHDVNWIYDFIDPFDPFYGKLSAFNNRVDTAFSTGNVFDPGFDMYSWEYPKVGDIWGPEEFIKTIKHPVPTEVYSTGLSSTQYLPNGNFLLCSGRTGYAVELTPDNDIAWEYKTPLIGGVPASQGDTLSINNNLTFRMTRYPVDYAAFDGKDLSSKGWIEQNPDSTICNQILPTFEQAKQYNLRIAPNPADQMITLTWDGGFYVTFEVFDLLGRPVIEPMTIAGGRKYLNTSGWDPGLFFVRINGIETVKVLVQH